MDIAEDSQVFYVEFAIFVDYFNARVSVKSMLNELTLRINEIEESISIATDTRRETAYFVVIISSLE